MMKGQRYLLLILVLSTCTLGYGQSKEIEEIKSQARQFSEFLVEQDIDGLLSIYTSDAKIFPNRLEILQGQQLAEYWTPSSDQTSKTISHKLTPVEIEILGDKAYDYGYFEGKSEAENGEMSSWKGKYVVIWKKEDGKWKMYLDIWNSITNSG